MRSPRDDMTGYGRHLRPTRTDLGREVEGEKITPQQELQIQQLMLERAQNPGLTIAHGIHEGLRPGSHNPELHRIPVDDSGNPIPQLAPKDQDIPDRYGKPIEVSQRRKGELNPLQIKTLKQIPNNLKDLSPEKKLNLMLKITGQVLEQA